MGISQKTPTYDLVVQGMG